MGCVGPRTPKPVRSPQNGHRPERGGALLAAGGLVHLLVEDSSARYSRTSWDISTALSVTVGEIEAAGHGTLAGTVHTHPAGVPEPSLLAQSSHEPAAGPLAPRCASCGMRRPNSA